jgi:hypothetical protein
MVTTRTGTEVRAPLPRHRRPARSPPRARAAIVPGVPVVVSTRAYPEDEPQEAFFPETAYGLLLVLLAVGLSIFVCQQERGEVAVPASSWKWRPFGPVISWPGW